MNLSQLFSALFTAIKSGLITTLVPDLLTFLQNTQKLDLLSVAGQAQYISQLDLLRSSAMAGLTTLAPTEIQQLNQTFSNEMEAALQKLLASTQTSTAAATPKAS